MNPSRIKNAQFEEQVVWKVMDKMFENKSTLVQHHFDSYEHFMSHRVQHIIDSFNPIDVSHEYDAAGDRFNHVVSIHMHNPRYVRTRVEEADGSETVITPMIARRRQMSYVANLVVDLDCKFNTYNADAEAYHVETKDILNVCIGKLPIMIRSRFCVLSEHPISLGAECMYDYGGYFIIQGTEKVLVSQDRLAENKVQVFVNNKATPFSVVAEVRSITIDGVVPKTTVVKVSNKETCLGFPIKANVHHVKVDVPIGVVFKAFGVSSDHDIVDMICYAQGTQQNAHAVSAIRKFLEASMWESTSVSGQEEAFSYLAQHLNVSGYAREQMSNPVIRIGILKKLLATECIPHVGEDFHKKAVFLAYMTNKLVSCTVGLQPFDDRDSYINKKVDCSGHLLTALTKQYMSKMIKDFRNGLQKEINSTNSSWRATKSLSSVLSRVNIYKLVKPTTITQGINYAMSTGNWHLKQSVKVKSGVAQVLNRMNYIATISHMRRVNTTIEKSGRLVQPRKVHSTNFGIICPCECFDPETPILTWEGTVKEAKDINVGDHLIDDLGNAVRVKSTCSGSKRMYEVVPDKINFMSYTVTDNHILTLKVKNANRVMNYRGRGLQLSWFDKEALRFRYKVFDREDEMMVFRSALGLEDTPTIDITIDTYLALPESVRKNLFVFKSDGINWEKKEVALDPYVLGMWLGDGMSSGFEFATADKELLDKWIEWAAANDAAIKSSRTYVYGISSIYNTWRGSNTAPAPLKKQLAKYGLVNNKHIPLDYIVNDRATRLAVLAGLVDTDGHVRHNGHNDVTITQGEKNYRILHDAEFLAMSLGFTCHVTDGMCSYTVNGEKRQRPYKVLYITGSKLYEIPTVLPRKKLAMFDDPVKEKRSQATLMSSFKLVEKDVQPFVGWQVEGNGRFLLKDMSVTHNTPEVGLSCFVLFRSLWFLVLLWESF